MSSTKESLPPEILDMLWHRVVEMGETRQEAMDRIKEIITKKDDEG